MRSESVIVQDFRGNGLHFLTWLVAETTTGPFLPFPVSLDRLKQQRFPIVLCVLDTRRLVMMEIQYYVLRRFPESNWRQKHKSTQLCWLFRTLFTSTFQLDSQVGIRRLHTDTCARKDNEYTPGRDS